MKEIRSVAIDYDNYPFSIDVILPEKDIREEERKYRNNAIREFSERMFYWVLPWFTIALLTVSNFGLWGMSGVALVFSTLIASGLILGRARRNRRIMYAFGFSSYAMIVSLAIIFSPVL